MIGYDRFEVLIFCFDFALPVGLDYKKDISTLWCFEALRKRYILFLINSWFNDFIICSFNFDDIVRSLYLKWYLHYIPWYTNLIVHNIKIMNLICKDQIIFLTINMQLKYVCLFIAVFIFYCLKFCYAEIKTFVSLSASKLNLIPKLGNIFINLFHLTFMNYPFFSLSFFYFERNVIHIFSFKTVYLLLYVITLLLFNRTLQLMTSQWM